MEYYGVSERKACRVLGQCRATQRYEPKYIDDEELLRSCVIDLASKYGRYGYKRITALLNQEGWKVNQNPNFNNMEIKKRNMVYFVSGFPLV